MRKLSSFLEKGTYICDAKNKINLKSNTVKIIKTKFPAGSVLSLEKTGFDYTDSFQGEVLDHDGNITTAEISKAFFTSTPQWGKKMFAFRNSIVKMFGLKTGTDNSNPLTSDNFNLKTGEQVGIFKVFDQTNNEIILGENDKHLDFRVSILYDKASGNEGNFLTVSTTVKYHNWMGIIYFLPVRPFHQLIVPVMLKKMIEKLESRS